MSKSCEECGKNSEIFCYSCNALFCNFCFKESHPADSLVFARHVSAQTDSMDVKTLMLRKDTIASKVSQFEMASKNSISRNMRELVKVSAQSESRGKYAIEMPIQKLKEQLNERIIALKKELKEVKEIQSLQNSEVMRWRGMVSKADEEIDRTLGVASRALNNRILDVLKFAENCRLQEEKDVIKNYHQVRHILTQLKVALSDAAKSDKTDDGIKYKSLSKALNLARNLKIKGIITEVGGSISLVDVSDIVESLKSRIGFSESCRVKQESELLFDRAQALFEQNQNSEGLETLIDSAEKGHTPAMIFLSNRIFNSSDSDRDESLAFDWAKRACESEFSLPEHHFYLGKLYWDGKGVKTDKETAIQCFLKAANSGYREAMFHLAVGISRRYFPVSAAKPWIVQCAALKHPESMIALGEMHLHGDCIEQSTDKALEIFQKVAEAGNPVGLYHLGMAHKSFGDIDNALKYLTEAGEQNYGPAYLALGYLYESGIGVTRDLTEALRHYDAAFIHGSISGLVHAAFIYEQEGPMKNLERAMRLYEKAAAANEPYALFKMGQYIEEGKVLPKRLKEAFSYYSKSAELGYDHAIPAIGRCYLMGIGVTKDISKALEYFTAGAEKEIPESNYWIGVMYIDGHLEDDVEKAKYHLKLAADGGFQKAQSVLETSSKRGFLISGEET